MLATQLVRLPTFHRLPSMILVEDLDHFSQAQPGRNLEFTASRCCAVLVSTASTCSRLAGRAVHLCACATAGIRNADERRDSVYGVYFDKMWSLNSQTKSDVTEAVLLKQKGGVSIEFCWLDDPILVLRRIYGRDEDKKVWADLWLRNMFALVLLIVPVKLIIKIFMNYLNRIWIKTAKIIVIIFYLSASTKNLKNQLFKILCYF